ncbi:MAG: hypothetical protein K8R53_08145 [Bacteroidales bacterium]|nr:hypothetical protein [Bacteroidales bacterium]
MKHFFFLKILFILTALFIAGCKKDENDKTNPEYGHLTINFVHKNNGNLLLFDTLIYTNAAGNPYMVNEIQYFISDFTLYYENGKKILINEWKDIHYVDTDILSTLTWEIYDDIPAGHYDSISFIFGFDEGKNQSFMYVNPPERDMFWPEYLGGGYHYMKLNGKWLPEGGNQTFPFDFHLGIGQEYYSYPDSITGFIQNYFKVPLTEPVVIQKSKTSEIDLFHIVDQWFEQPHIYNHDIYGGYIMQNQEAMEKVKENGKNVFIFEPHTNN